MFGTDEGQEGQGVNTSEQQSPNPYQQNHYDPNPYQQNNYNNYNNNYGNNYNNNYNQNPNTGVNLYANVSPMNIQGPSNNDFISQNNNNSNLNNAPPPYIPPSNVNNSGNANNNNSNNNNNNSQSCLESIAQCCGLSATILIAIIIGTISLINILTLVTFTVEVDTYYNDSYDWCKKEYGNWTSSYYSCDSDAMTDLCRSDSRCWAPGDSYYGDYCDTDYNGSCKCCASKSIHGWWIYWLTWISWIGCCEIVRMFMILISSTDEDVIEELRDTHWLFCMCLCNPDKGWENYKKAWSRNGFRKQNLPFCIWWILFCELLPMFAIFFVYMNEEGQEWTFNTSLCMLTTIIRLLITWRRICQKNEDKRNHNHNCDCDCNC